MIRHKELSDARPSAAPLEIGPIPIASCQRQNHKVGLKPVEISSIGLMKSRPNANRARYLTEVATLAKKVQ